jgi:hypothetical protein
MHCSAHQGARLHRQRACFSRASPARPHTNRIISQACRIGAFRESSPLDRDSCVHGGLGSLSSRASARSQHKRWQVAAGPPAFPEPDSGATVGVKDTDLGQTEGSSGSLASNGAKPSNGAVTANGAVSSAAAVAPEVQQGGIAHRWRIVLMMATAFVLCNMDKVGV